MRVVSSSFLVVLLGCAAPPESFRSVNPPATNDAAPASNDAAPAPYDVAPAPNDAAPAPNDVAPAPNDAAVVERVEDVEAATEHPTALDAPAAPADLAPAAATVVLLADARWERASTGYGYVHFNRSIDNGPLRLAGARYAKGLGVHAPSELTYALGGACSAFDAEIGLDQEAGSPGSVVFAVYADDAKIYDSGKMDARTPKKTVSVVLTGAQKLRLVVSDAGDGIDSDHADWANARLTVAAGRSLPAPPAADIGDASAPKGDPYDHKVTWLPERPYVRDYTQLAFTKLFLAQKDPADPANKTLVIKTFEQARDALARLDRLMVGAPKIVYLVGWQYNGHDSKYPAWAEVNQALKRAADATAADSLRWLMSEGPAAHTIVSLHINMFDATPDSPLWKRYLDADVIAKETNGTLIPGETFDGQVSYQVDYAKEWSLGLAKQRIDGLLAFLPVRSAGTVHIDAFHSVAPSHPTRPISPLNGHTLAEQQSAQRTILRYWRQQGVDVTSEYTSGSLKPDAFYGLQAGSWHSQIGADIPPYLAVATPLEDLEGQVRANDWAGVKRTVGTRFLAWHYRNDTTAEIGLEPHEDGAGNTFYPALWRRQTIVAYSAAGYAPKSWTLPPGWGGVTAVDLYEATPETYTKVTSVPATANGEISFGMSAGQELVLVPAGTPLAP